MTPDVELLQALVAGWIAGAIAGLINTAVVLVVLARRPRVAEGLRLPVSLTAFGIVFANAFVIALTLVGLGMGVAHHRVGGGPGGVFTLAVFGAVLGVAVLYAFVRGRVRSAEAPAVLGGLLVVAAAFGLLLPWLASMEA